MDEKRGEQVGMDEKRGEQVGMEEKRGEQVGFSRIFKFFWNLTHPTFQKMFKIFLSDYKIKS